MATKKLKVELELETAKAKRQAKELENSSGSGGGHVKLSEADRKLAQAYDKASKESEKLAKATREGSESMRHVSKVFGGMAIRMAAGYAAKNMEAGPAQTAVKGIGDVASGAIAGAAFGPWGAVAGGLIGLTGALVDATNAERDREDAIRNASKGFRQGEKTYAEDKAFAEKLKGLSETDKHFTDFAGRIKAINEELEKYRGKDKIISESIAGFIKSGQNDNAATWQNELARNRSRESQLESVRDQLMSRQKLRDEGIADANKDWTKSESDYAGDRAFASRLKGLTEIERGFTDFAGRIRSINDELKTYQDEEAKLKEKIGAALSSGDTEGAADLRKDLSTNRSRQSSLENARDQMEKLTKTTAAKDVFRESFGAADALSRIGANFAGGDVGRDQLRVQQEMASTLKSIDSKTNAGGTTWR